MKYIDLLEFMVGLDILYGLGKFDFVCNRIRYLVIRTSGVTYIIYHNYAKIKVDSYDFYL